VSRAPDGSAVTEALTLLTTPPTGAPIELHPDVVAGPGLAGWYPMERLTSPDVVTRVVDAYSASLGTRHRAAAAACGLQSCAGRVAVATIGLWVQTGAVPDPHVGTWHLRLDGEGRTAAVAPPVTGTVPVGEASDVARLLVEKHLADVVTAFREVGRITARLALGCIAASCASVLAGLHRRAPEAHQEELARVTRELLAAPVWSVAGRRLVTTSPIRVPAGPALVTERHTCCLMRLGDGRQPCGSCPDITPEERRRRTTHHATFAPRGEDLPVVVARVA